MFHSKRYALGLLILVTVLAYANTLPNSFVWDDEVLVCENSAIRNFTHVPALFTTGLFHHDSGSTAYYRPLQPLTFMVDYYIWGLNAAGYHLTNLLLHLLCVILLWRLIDRLSHDPLVALGVALLFAVHPVNTNAVSYIAGRADPLALAAMLGAFLLFVRSQDQRADPRPVRLLRYAAAIVCYVAALFSRESAMMFPALILTYSLTLGASAKRPGRAALAAALPFLVVLIAFFCWRTAVLEMSGQTLLAPGTMSRWLRVQTGLRALATYGGLLVWPAHLQMERQVVIGGCWLDVLAVAGLLLALGLSVAVWWSRQRSVVVFFGLLWFVVMLLPLTGIFNLIATVAEHWLYVPAIGLYLASCSVGVGAWRSLHETRPGWRPRLAVALGAVALVALTARTIRRNEDWADSATFFAATKQASAHASTARVNLGRQYLGQGDWEKARDELADAERLSPNDSFAKGNLAALYLLQGDLAKALAKNQECLQLDPQDLGAHLRLAFIQEQRQDLAQAQRHFLYATALSETAYPRLVFGRFLLRHHRDKECIQIATEAEDLEPGNAEVFDLLGAAYAESHQPVLAEHAFRQAQRLDRHSPSAAVNLGRLAYQRGDLTAATVSYRRALRLQPRNVPALYYLGLIGWQRGELTVARERMQEALAAAPRSLRIQDALQRITRGEPFRALPPEQRLAAPVTDPTGAGNGT